MFILFTRRVLKRNTHSTEKYAPRSQNVELLTVSGPFVGKAAQQALVAVLATHTCLEAQLRSEVQTRELHARGYGRNGDEWQTALDTAVQLLDGAAQRDVRRP